MSFAKVRQVTIPLELAPKKAVLHGVKATVTNNRFFVDTQPAGSISCPSKRLIVMPPPPPPPLQGRKVRRFV